jgi:hypothetical protein
MNKEFDEFITICSVGILLHLQKNKSSLVTEFHPKLLKAEAKLQYLFFSQLGKYPFPANSLDFLDLLHTPVEQWGFKNHNWMGSLLFHGRPTDLCYDIGIRYANNHSDIELDNKPFVEMMDYCKKHKLPSEYTKIRLHLLINNFYPSLGRYHLDIFSNTFSQFYIKERLQSCYEKIPSSSIHDGKIALCPRCSWVLNWIGNDPICYSEQCGQIVDLHSAKWVNIEEGTLRTKKGIQFSIAAPEKGLIKLGKWIEKKLKLQISYWPNLDEYDLEIIFPQKTTWVIDYKNYRNPYDLKNKLENSNIPIGEWEKGFYILPNERKETGYLELIRSSVQQPNVEIMYEDQFRHLLKRRIQHDI